ncbi:MULTISPECIES: MinD/ParA family ATP-binding protein [unclassified Rhodococcus (in: high G+C Gram-positive bacteria)]|uniref:MinD/ParA family ATP-binding protein n=1 Tax=unclassified Rhodococcus (in: high G+C Gram-positive bacteria) TaxID=192944 RepID=UPI000AD8990F|nr:MULTISPECIES: MinD/ParA family protein [unclassified Rhodococcus (in: high G+C Gram-positive bacteria)]
MNSRDDDYRPRPDAPQTFPPQTPWSPPAAPSPRSTAESGYTPVPADPRRNGADWATVARRPDAGKPSWRRALDRLWGQQSGVSADARREQQIERIRQPISSDYRIAFLSLKGGVGKTTITVGLGSVLASLRRDNVIAVDANPDFGTLGERIPRQTMSTVRDLLAARPRIRSYADIREHTSQSSSRLEVVAGERDPAASEAFTEQDYRAVIDTLRAHYNLILTDCGTGIMHSAMDGVLSLAHALVLVSSPAVDGAKSAAATLDWLGLHGYAHLVERTVVVISAHRPGAASIDMDELERHFLARCRAVVVVPFDPHLAEGSIVEIDRLRPRTRAAFMQLAELMADDFPDAGGRHASSQAPVQRHRTW